MDVLKKTASFEDETGHHVNFIDNVLKHPVSIFIKLAFTSSQFLAG